MKFKQTFNLLLIALFMFAFQSTTIHIQHQVIDEISDCNLCHTSEQLDLHHQNSSVVVVNENFAIKTREHVEKIVVRSRFDYTDVSPFKRVDIVENLHYTVQSLPLGFYATAPPYFIS